jgi:hypothetical protein
MVRLDRQCIVCAGAAIVAALLSLSVANAESASDNASAPNWDEVFAQVLPDKTSISRQNDWLDDSALAYAKSKPSSTTPALWLAQPLPAVDGFNAKIDGYGGGANHISSLYGASGSLAFPLAQQWGAQIDGGVGSFNSSGTSFGAGHVFWRDPSVGLLGAYGSYSQWNGTNTALIPRTALSIGRYAAEGELYWGRWTLGGIGGYESVRIPAVVAGLPTFSIPNRFFDAVHASYYVTDDFNLSIGHIYTIGRNALTLGSEYGFALGGGRMASLFADGTIGETGLYSARGGLRIYFGQHDKTLIDRNRQDDPDNKDAVDLAIWAGQLGYNIMKNEEARREEAAAAERTLLLTTVNTATQATAATVVSTSGATTGASTSGTTFGTTFLP